MINIFILAALLLTFFIQTQSLDTYSHKYCTISLFHAFDSVNGSITMDTSPLTPPESPRFAIVNSTAWEQWYFDSVALDGRSNSVITFFRDPSLDILDLGILWVMHDAVWSNGTRSSVIEFVEEARVVVCPGYTFGVWNSTAQNVEFLFNVTSDVSQASISVSTPKTQGSLSITSLGPARYPGGLLYPNRDASTSFAPMLWWVEAMLAGNAQVDFKIGGSEIAFTGYGGVDYFAGSYIWDYICRDWHWMRGVVGPYSIVFWQFASALDITPTPRHFSSKMVRILNSGLTTAGSQAAYATITLLFGAKGNITALAGLQGTGYALDFFEGTAKGAKGRSWHFETEHENVGFSTGTSTNSLYTRFADSAKGGENGQKGYSGAMNTEQIVTKVVYPLF